MTSLAMNVLVVVLIFMEGLSRTNGAKTFMMNFVFLNMMVETLVKVMWLLSEVPVLGDVVGLCPVGMFEAGVGIWVAAPLTLVRRCLTLLLVTFSRLSIGG